MIAPAFTSLIALAATATPFPAAAEVPDILGGLASARDDWISAGLPDLTNEITIIGTLTVVVPWFRER